MKFNKKAQYGLLICLYLARSGKATGKNMSEGLGIKFHMLTSIACELVRGGVLEGFKGKGGGFALKGDPTVREILIALDTPVTVLDEDTLVSLSRGHSEHRALVQFTRNLKAVLAPLLSRKIKNVAMEIVASDMATLNRAGLTAQVN